VNDLFAGDAPAHGAAASVTRQKLGILRLNRILIENRYFVAARRTHLEWAAAAGAWDAGQ